AISSRAAAAMAEVASVIRVRVYRKLLRPGVKTSGSDVEQDVQDVPVLDDVLLAFGAKQAALLRLRFRTAGDEVFEADNLRPDEAALQVAVDLSRRNRR